MPDELEKYIQENLTVVGKSAYDAIKEVVTEEAQACYEAIKAGTPVRTGGLRDSLTIEEVSDPVKNIYGYNIDYKGYDKYQVAYSYIGRTLNKGTSKIPAVRHLDKAVRKLKGMDDRINKRYIEKIDRPTED